MIEIQSNGIVRNFEDSRCFDSLAPYSDKIAEAFRSFDIGITRIWFDIGSSIYDLHIEVTSKYECDLYYKIEKNQLIETAGSLGKGTLFEELNALSPNEEKELCLAIKEYQSYKGGK